MNKKPVIFLFCMITLFVSSQNNYHFNNYTINDGLSQSVVNSLVQDNSGSIWIGTQDGLNRFDGQSFEIFTSDNTKGIQSIDFLCSMKSKNGDLWFGTSNGLTKYDPILERFITFNYSSQFALQVRTIVEDNAGNVWIGTISNGIYILKKNAKKITKASINIPSERIYKISFISSTELIISTEDKGVFIHHFPEKNTYSIGLNGKKGRFIRLNTIQKFNGDDWIIGSSQGLYLMNKLTKKIKPFLTKLDRNFGYLDISDISIINVNKFLLTTKSNGLFTIFISSSGINIHHSTQDIFQKQALLYDALNTMIRDENGTFWIGSQRGLSSFDPLNQGFLGVGPTGDLTKGIPTPSVWSFSEDKSGRYLFIGLESAVSRIDKKTGMFIPFFKPKELDNSSLTSNILTSYVISPSNILVGASDGLFLLNISSKKEYTFKKIKFKNLNNPSNYSRVYDIEHWKDSRYFISTKGGVLLFDKQTSKVTVFEHDDNNPSMSLGKGVCRMIYKDLSGKIWFSSSSGGLYQFSDKKELKIIPYEFNYQIAKLSKENISNMVQTDEETFWLATLGSGMIKWNSKIGKGSLINKKSGLPNNVVYGILQERDNLWLSTNKGLAKYAISSKKITNFTEKDGLMSNEFNQGAFLKSKNGQLYFGGIYGYNYFDPQKLSIKEGAINVRLTKIRFDKNWLKPDPSSLLPISISLTKHILLPYKKRSITLKFMATEMSNPSLISYKYILEGSEDGEVFIGSTNQIHLNSIQPGEYVLKIYARIGDGKWGNTPCKLALIVKAPYWKTIWFWIVVSIFIAGLALFYFKNKIKIERKQQLRLEQKITERTKEIREQNIKIEKQKRTIEEKKNHLEEQKFLLEIEKEKTENVLKNILPVSIYEEIKETGKASARAYSRVSVLFTDFVGFTKIAETMKPSELVRNLDVYFRKFDEIIVRNNLEKIKTIGDAYMCAGGVPKRNKTNPIDACLAALEIQFVTKEMSESAEQAGKAIWKLRLGINTGEVTAGVIGTEKLAYDIWGSTVNQAQRMEMLGESGKVTISGHTFNHIEPYFDCTFRGKVKTKSQGLIDMYTVDGIKVELSIDGLGVYPNERFHEILNLHTYSSINYYLAEHHIMKLLEEKLSPKLHYHSLIHTKDVCKSIERIALLEGITDEGLFLLKSAATYHDAGFIEAYDNNEHIGAKMAENSLPEFGYKKEHIDQIKDLIFVTAIPHNPTNKLEEIICDADLDYLGRDDFHEIADKLRLELKEYGKIDSDRQWDEIQVAFLTNHRYFTKTAIDSRKLKKEQNLEDIKQRLIKNEYD